MKGRAHILSEGYRGNIIRRIGVRIVSKVTYPYVSEIEKLNKK